MLTTALLAAWLGLMSGAFSSELSLLNQTAAPGTSIVIPVMFTSQNSFISGVQFDVQYDSASMSLAATVGDPVRYSNKNLYVADLPANTKRFLMFGLNQNTIADGPLINLFVNLNQTISTGLYSLKLSNLAATDPYGNSISLTGTDGTVTVQGTVGQSVRLQQQGVLNGASLLSGPIAPGEVITLVGSGIGPASSQQPIGSPSSTVLGGTSVLFDGRPAPLLYGAPSQINAIVPFGLSTTTTTQVEVFSQGQAIARLPLSVVSTVPAIFTLDPGGVGPGAVLNQDSSVNSPSNPADKGSVVSVFATGAGQTDPPGVDGQVAGAILPTPLLPVSVRISGLDAQITYAGAAPGLIAGVMQVNCLIPPDAPSGPAVPITFNVGPTRSQAGVTLAIKLPTVVRCRVDIQDEVSQLEMENLRGLERMRNKFARVCLAVVLLAEGQAIASVVRKRLCQQR
jgi:uncharacterized protein (TIGR03437 family)